MNKIVLKELKLAVSKKQVEKLADTNITIGKIQNLMIFEKLLSEKVLFAFM